MPRGACRGEDPELFFPVTAAGRPWRRSSPPRPCASGARYAPRACPTPWPPGRPASGAEPPRRNATPCGGRPAFRPASTAPARAPWAQRHAIAAIPAGSDNARRRTAFGPAAYRGRASPARWQRHAARALAVQESHDEPASQPAARPGPDRASASGGGSRPRLAVRVLHHADAARGNASDRAGAGPPGSGSCAARHYFRSSRSAWRLCWRPAG